MNRPGWNSQRRNRNIGTAKSGYGQNNRMCIPERWADGHLFYERLDNLVAFSRIVGDHKITMLVEPVQAGFLHACTPDDIVKVLSLLPSQHVASIDLIVLRQPKRKQRLLRPVWGRLQYWSEINQYTGVAIHLEAQLINGVQRWHRSLTPDDAQELERLGQDGHQIIPERRYYQLYTSLESIRNTQLYRTLPHEVGHHVDYFESVEKHATEDADEREQLIDLYWSKPEKDKEAFAHRYATEFCEREKKAGHIPFERILNEDTLVAEGLEISWFR
ncbi:hypothetical protein NIES4071_52430 [Calothrix sp. NIES-4071]|nr:hypothetical protein NIES4071_52430 [Calothrix sp. NIES-4071]BAZ59551.1 hypothetical protein NIES4105_52380 [Calothrix sp. NIES-4105]